MESLLKQDQINFQVLDEKSNTLQVVLLPSQALYTEITYVLYHSSNLSIRELSVSFWKKLTNLELGFRYRIKNRKGGVEYVGLSKSFGKILALNPFVIEDTFIVNNNCLLAYSSGINVSQVFETNPLLKKIY